MDANHVAHMYTPRMRSGVFVRRRRTYVTQRNEEHVYYRQSPLYHPYARLVPERVELKSTFITTTVDEDVFIPHCVVAQRRNDYPCARTYLPGNPLETPPYNSNLELYAHPEQQPCYAPSQIKAEDRSYSLLTPVKPESSEPSMPNPYHLRPVEWTSGQSSDATKLEDGYNLTEWNNSDHCECSPMTLIDRAMTEQRHVQPYKSDEHVPLVKLEPVD